MEQFWEKSVSIVAMNCLKIDNWLKNTWFEGDYQFYGISLSIKCYKLFRFCLFEIQLRLIGFDRCNNSLVLLINELFWFWMINQSPLVGVIWLWLHYLFLFNLFLSVLNFLTRFKGIHLINFDVLRHFKYCNLNFF